MEAQQINTAPVIEKKFFSQWSVWVALLLTATLSVSTECVEIVALPTLMDLMTRALEHPLKGSVIDVIVLRDFSSTVFSALVSIVAVCTGCLPMIAVCNAASIAGLVLPWVHPSPSYKVVYSTIFLQAFGKGGQKQLENVVEYCWQKIEKGKEKNDEELGRRKNSQEQDSVDGVGVFRLLILKVSVPLVSNVILLLDIYVFHHDGEYKSRFKLSTILLSVSYVLFFIGYCVLYGRNEFPAESSQSKFSRFCKWDSKYEACTINDERKVKKSNVVFILNLTFVTYFILQASGNTFFVSEARSGTPIFTNSIGNYICILLIWKSFAKTLSTCACQFFSTRAIPYIKKFKNMDARSEKKACTILKICYGKLCEAICWVIAYTTEGNLLIFRYILLGMAEGLAGIGFENLLHDHLPESMWRFEHAISVSVFGICKLIVCILRIWFLRSVSHLNIFYLISMILSIPLLLIFAYFSIKYAYKKECSEDQMKRTSDSHLQLLHQDSSLPYINESPNMVDVGWSSVIPYGKSSEADVEKSLSEEVSEACESSDEVVESKKQASGMRKGSNSETNPTEKNGVPRSPTLPSPSLSSSSSLKGDTCNVPTTTFTPHKIKDANVNYDVIVNLGDTNESGNDVSSTLQQDLMGKFTGVIGCVDSQMNENYTCDLSKDVEEETPNKNIDSSEVREVQVVVNKSVKNIPFESGSSTQPRKCSKSSKLPEDVEPENFICETQHNQLMDLNPNMDDMIVLEDYCGKEKK